MIGRINSLETFGLVDGPGIRFVVFLQGCPLRCIFCHNPETWNINDGYEITSEELIKKVLKYKNYLKDGGITFSGGEPLFQKEFLLECLKLAKTCNIHTALDTAGVGSDYEEILKYTDLVIFDIKGLDNYQNITGSNPEASLEFLNTCQKLNKKMWLRQVIIPGINDTEEYILELKEFIKPLKNIEKVELLPYHSFGKEKYEELNINYKLKDTKDMDERRLKELEELLNK